MHCALCFVHCVLSHSLTHIHTAPSQSYSRRARNAATAASLVTVAAGACVPITLQSAASSAAVRDPVRDAGLYDPGRGTRAVYVAFQGVGDTGASASAGAGAGVVDWAAVKDMRLDGSGSRVLAFERSTQWGGGVRGSGEHGPVIMRGVDLAALRGRTLSLSAAARRARASDAAPSPVPSPFVVAVADMTSVQGSKVKQFLCLCVSLSLCMSLSLAVSVLSL